MVELVTITDPNLPEPKGVASATEFQVYLADGAGSGTWIDWPFGWGFYKDNAAGQSIGNTYTKLTNNAGDASTNNTYLPPAIRGSDTLWDSTNSLITPMTIGDSYVLRIDLPITGKTGSPNKIDFALDIGGDTTPTVSIVEREITTTASTPFTVSIGFPIFCLNTFVTNGGQIFLKTDTGTVTVTNPGISIFRTSAGDI